MADETPVSIREVLVDAAQREETPASPTPASTPPPASETPEAPSSSPTPEGEGKPEESPEPVHKELKESIDTLIAELPPEKQEALRKNLKDYDRHFHRSLRQVAEVKRFVERLSDEFPGVTAAEVAEAVASRRRPSLPASSPVASSPETTADDIDALIEKATDPAVREELRKSKAVLHREMDRRLAEKLKPIQDELDRLRQTTLSGREADVERQIDALEDEHGFPSSVIEKHRPLIRSMALKLNKSAQEALQYALPYADLQAAFEGRTKPPPATPKPAPKGKTEPARTVSTSPTQPGGTLDRFRQGRSGWDVKSALRAMLPKG